MCHHHGTNSIPNLQNTKGNLELQRSLLDSCNLPKLSIFEESLSIRDPESSPLNNGLLYLLDMMKQKKKKKSSPNQISSKLFHNLNMPYLKLPNHLKVISVFFQCSFSLKSKTFLSSIFSPSFPFAPPNGILSPPP